MLTLSEALSQLLVLAEPVQALEEIDTIAADGRVLACDQISSINVPPMDNTQMDGYAIDSEALQGAQGFEVSQRIPAGHLAQRLKKGTVARVFTGAFIPEGADAVVMQEQVRIEGDKVFLLHQPRAGEWIRRAGEDIRVGARILAQGDRLTPQALGLAASVGLAKLPVYRRVRVACFFTGDELTMPGEVLKPGSIYNSNRFVLVNLLRRLGCEVEDLGIIADKLDQTRAALRQAADRCDLIVSSGGMSVGEEDHVKPAVEAEGVLRAWQIAIKPGKPLAWGRIQRPMREAHFIGLPGNPVSSFVTFLLFVQPFILKLQGRRDWSMRPLLMRADFDWLKPDKRREFLRVRLNAEGGLERFPNQSSGVLTSTVWGDGLAEIEPNTAVRQGELIPYHAFNHWYGES
ncbi:MAG: molybdopterin molybdenumtransferase MoeA [Betaproteobacteria bacterium]|nr:molybdopterin molybdenumtransferase MoeA [Betaproteobacteria bacterium]NBT81775.1 molybdopterin molybdenumtransferase MoeA [Betaproteobacteria bacterium]NBY54002.1 molybdopterin molybdenumtransferase MoeA [Betaproteobacteria bacterium]NCV13185.1 molybdopterin molybdenumtransferase MoeA [Betaproteobacteria bacterium]NDC02741.1 molybdopterin molybdenumtransferase MoeA [Betaproteobacteria bacterium]